jgi:hypothetical protein
MCWKHYQRWLRYGHPLAMPERERWQDRVLARVKQPIIGCWLYPSVSERPARLRTPEGRRVDVRVVVWEEMVGPLPVGARLSPLCGTVHCVNPQHQQVVHVATAQVA